MTDAEAAAPTAASFEPFRGSTFAMASADRVLPDIRLDEVTSYGAQPGAPRADPFSLIFSGDLPVLEQQTYTLAHPAFGTVDVFLVPLGIDRDGRVRYEAVFN